MHPPDSGILQNQKKTKAFQSQSTCRFSIAETPGIWLNRLTRRWSIHRKIAYGYVLAISIAVMGTTAGLIVGEHYDDKASEKFRKADEKYELMARLEKAAIDVKIQQQQIMATPENKVRQQDELIKLLNRINEAKEHLSRLQSKLKDDDNLSREYLAKLNSLLQTCNTDLELYTALVQSLLEKIDKLLCI